MSNSLFHCYFMRTCGLLAYKKKNRFNFIFNIELVSILNFQLNQIRKKKSNKFLLYRRNL